MEIQGYPNYLIYPDGRVFTKKRPYTAGKFKTQTMMDGYPYVNLYNDGKKKMKKIHRLIAEHYIPNPQNKQFVDHINRIRDDNRIENLRWVTSSENNTNMGIKSSNKSGHKWISLTSGKYCYYRYSRKNNGKCIHKINKDLSKIICYSFFYLLKFPPA
tara:strand:- start:46 stop:519 length:474 start_codon:yes stop_codon:yes gene_type:complete